MRPQSLRHLIAGVLLLAGAALIVTDAQAQGVRFLTPADGDSVRGVVKLQATMPTPGRGWISYKIQKGGQGDFVIAVVDPFVSGWDTRARDESGKDLYDDGQYTVTAAALSTQGKKVGEATITVTLKNAISASDRPESVDLRLDYERLQQVRYQAVGSWDIKPAQDEEEPDDVYELAKDANGAMVAEWREKVMTPTVAGNRAVLHIIVGSAGSQMASEEEPQVYPNAGKVHTYIARPDGVKQLKHEDEDVFDLAELYVRLPARPLRVGDNWTSEMRVLPVPQVDTEVRVLRAQHRVEGFEWLGGYKCLRIRSQFKADNEKLSLNLRPKSQQAGIFGGEEGAFAAEDPAMMGAPGAMGMEPGMEMGMEFGMEMGMGGEGQQVEEIETSYVGDRITYFAYELNRPIKIIDTITHTLEIERAAAAMGGPEGMMEGEAMPAFEEMPPEEPMGPGAMGPPGAMAEMGMEMGFGGVQAQPVTPMKVKINVKLEISEVPL